MNQQEWRKSADLQAMIDHVGPAFTPRKQRLLAAAGCRRLKDLLSDPRAWAAVDLLERAADEKVKKADWTSARERLEQVLAEAQNQEQFESNQVMEAREASRAADREAESHEYGAFRVYETAVEEMTRIASHHRIQAVVRALTALQGLLADQPAFVQHMGELAEAVGLQRRANAWFGPRADIQQASEMEAARGRRSRQGRALAISQAVYTVQEATEQATERATAIQERGIRDEKKHHCALLRDLMGDPFSNRPSIKPAWLKANGGAVKKLAQTIYLEHSFTQLGVLADALEEAGCTDTVLLSYCRQPAEHARGCWVLDLILGKE